jgi:hypothetical protein
VTPMALNQFATCRPSWLSARPPYPPPGATMTDVPERLGPQGRYTVSVGLSSSPCPSAPGAPFSHNRIICVSAVGSWCAWPSAMDAEKRQRTTIVLVRVVMSNQEAEWGWGPTNRARTCCVPPTLHQGVPDHRMISASQCRWLKVRRTGWRGAPPPVQKALLRGTRRSSR